MLETWMLYWWSWSWSNHLAESWISLCLNFGRTIADDTNYLIYAFLWYEKCCFGYVSTNSWHKRTLNFN